MYYFIVWIILAISAMYNYARNDKYARLWAIVSYLSLMLMAGLRYETGTDYLAYVEIYNSTAKLSNLVLSDYSIEPLYTFLNSIFRSIGADINIMFLFISSITIALSFNSFKHYLGQKYYLFSVILYYSTTFFLLDMSGVRQAIVFSILLFSIRYIIERNFWKYLLLLIIAFFFHRSAILLFIVYPLSLIHIKSRVHYSILGVGLALIALKISWLIGVLQVAAELFVSGPMAGKISAFLTNEFFSVQRTITPGLFSYVIFFVIAVWRRKDWEQITPYFNTILNIYLLFIISLFYLYESKDISIRVGAYFNLGYVLILPVILSKIKQNVQNLAIGISVILFISIYAVRLIIIPGSPITVMYHPYQNYIMYKMGFVKSNAEQRYHNFEDNLEE